MRVFALTTAAAALTASSASANDSEFCAQLETFETAPLPDNTSQTRWIELHWQGRWLDFESGWKLVCASSEDAASKKLCNYVVTDTSYEFASRFPQRILACHGYRVPTGISKWRGEIDVSMADDRWHRLIVDLGERDGDSGAVRYLSVSDETAGGNDVEYLPIEPLDDGPRIKSGMTS